MADTSGARIVAADARAAWSEMDPAAFDARKLSRADRAADRAGQSALFYVAETPRARTEAPTELPGQEGLF